MTSVNGINTDTTPIKGSVSSPFPDGISADYFGTVTVNGATPVTVTQALFSVGDIISFGLKTIGGTVGNIPFVSSGTTGTSFAVTGTAGDTSVYNYWGFTPTSQA